MAKYFYISGEIVFCACQFFLVVRRKCSNCMLLIAEDHGVEDVVE